MTTKATAEPAQRRRPLSDFAFALEKAINKLQREYLDEVPSARADLARLRRGLGKPAGSVPEIWEATIGAVPDALSGHQDTPNRAEQAAHAALTLYAVHQQSQRVAVHVPGVSFGSAVRRLASGDGPSRDAVTRRFMAVATAETIDEILVHVRGLITQLKAKPVGLDYAQFADDVRGLLTPGFETRVRLRWGRDFYRTDRSTDKASTTEPTENTSPDSNDEEQRP